MIWVRVHGTSRDSVDAQSDIDGIRSGINEAMKEVLGSSITSDQIIFVADYNLRSCGYSDKFLIIVDGTELGTVVAEELVETIVARTKEEKKLSNRTITCIVRENENDSTHTG